MNTMKRPILWGAVIGVLVALNIWRWWPQGSELLASADGGTWTARDVQLRQAVTPNPVKPVRDLFFVAHRTKKPTPSARTKRPGKTAARKVADDPKTLASSAMAHYELTAVAKQNAGRHALVMRNGESHTVIEGDVLDGRYLVKTITSQSLELRDKTTGAAITLRLGNE